MAMDTLRARSGLEIIPRRECLQLLASQKVGRLGFVQSGQPMVLPVNYTARGDVVMFQTGEGTMLEAGHGARVAFEVDEIDAGNGAGWSVVVQGVTEEIPATGDWFDASLRPQPESSWIPTPTDHLIRINPTVVSGRRLRRLPAS